MKYKVVFTNSYGNPVKEDGSLLLNNQERVREHFFDDYDSAKIGIDSFLEAHPEHEAMLHWGDDYKEFKIFYGSE